MLRKNLLEFRAKGCREQGTRAKEMLPVLGHWHPRWCFIILCMLLLSPLLFLVMNHNDYSAILASSFYRLWEMSGGGMITRTLWFSGSWDAGSGLEGRDSRLWAGFRNWMALKVVLLERGVRLLYEPTYRNLESRRAEKPKSGFLSHNIGQSQHIFLLCSKW